MSRAEIKRRERQAQVLLSRRPALPDFSFGLSQKFRCSTNCHCSILETHEVLDDATSLPLEEDQRKLELDREDQQKRGSPREFKLLGSFKTCDWMMRYPKFMGQKMDISFLETFLCQERKRMTTQHSGKPSMKQIPCLLACCMVEFHSLNAGEFESLPLIPLYL